MVRSTDFCFKITYVGMFLCFRSSVHCFQCFVRGSSSFGKKFPVNPPCPTEITTFKPPSPLEFPMIFRGGWGGGVWIFSGTTHYYLAGSETLKPTHAVLHIIMYRICSKRKMQKEKEGFGKFQVITGPLAPSTVPTNDEK